MDLKTSHLRHAALAQLHRWYIGYEQPAYGIANMLDILSPDITVKSGLGEAKGHAAYAERVSKLPASWQNAHWIKSAAITVPDGGAIQLDVNITYLNKGILPDGAVRTADLTYSASMAKTESVLPKFTSIAIAQNSDGIAAEFRSAYGENRLKSLAQYWLALVENPLRDAGPFAEILADEFTLNFSTGPINTLDGLARWLEAAGSRVAASAHEIGSFRWSATGEDQYALTMDFDWEGITPDGVLLGAKSRHAWLVLDNLAHRFARIARMDVELLEPFAPKKIG